MALKSAYILGECPNLTSYDQKMKAKIDLSKIKTLLQNKVQFAYELKCNSKELWVSNEKSTFYVEPELSFVSELSTCDKIEDSQVILVSAVGATGKSELTKSLSYDLKIPVVDLGNARVVASNSLTGLIFQYLSPIDGGNFLQNLQNGDTCMVIDALDEGYQKTNTQGFFDFLDDVISKLAKKGCSCVMLGRTNAIEMCSLYLDEKGIKAAVLQIEPFPLRKAQEFIDKRVETDLSEQHKTAYRVVRDYVLESLGDFFSTDSSEGMNQYGNFIGYAPVLLAISEFLNGEKVRNYKTLLENLRSCQFRSMSLILDIINRILDRDKNDKIVPNLINKIINNRESVFRKKALEEAYTQEEQCARVLYLLLGEEYPYKPIDDEAFNVEYTKGLETWMKDHPFLLGRKPANVVFECYILAKLIKIDKYKDAVYRYMNRRQTSSFMFFYLYKELNKDEFISEDIVPYLYNSLKTLDSKEAYYSLEMGLSEKYNEEDIYDVSFVSSDQKLQNYVFRTKLNKDLCWHGTISGVTIEISRNFVMCDERTEMQAPSYIHCKTFIVKSNEVNFSCRDLDTHITIEAENILSDTASGNVTKVHEAWCDRKNLVLICSEPLTYPFCDFQRKMVSEKVEKSKVLYEIYNKMRRTLIMFRSHSKGRLAKHHAKIDNRIGNTDLGKAVIKALLEKHIIYKDEHVYVIDNNSMSRFLGVKFDGIRSCTITKTMLTFLSEIEKSLDK